MGTGPVWMGYDRSLLGTFETLLSHTAPTGDVRLTLAGRITEHPATPPTARSRAVLTTVSNAEKWANAATRRNRPPRPQSTPRQTDLAARPPGAGRPSGQTTEQ